ncbi:Syntaxin-72 [Zea mays]|uniref:Syntaxin-72 n=1 Tax=Zea mays TaxID=4577 RepID=A0A1D6I2Q2_MAIZE|nr:Syntaxin-72 [Zea mays]
MSMIDVITRVDAICKKYERYDTDKHGDPFSRLYAAVDAGIDAAIEVSGLPSLGLPLAALKTKSARAAKKKKNRAASVTLDADVRRTKARLLEVVVKLQKVAARKVNGLSPEEKVSRAAERLEEGYFQTSEESEQFRREYEMRRMKQTEFRWDVQDEGLDFVSQGLDTLKNLAEDMNQELDRQVPLIDEIDTKVDKASLEIRRTNVRLRQTVNQFRSTRNFTIDIILICIILGIATYLYNILSQ